MAAEGGAIWSTLYFYNLSKIFQLYCKAAAFMQSQESSGPNHSGSDQTASYAELPAAMGVI